VISESVYAQAIAGLLAPLAAHFEDATVSEILVNGPHEVYVERRGRLEPSPARFDSAGALLSALRAVAQFAGRPLDREHPILEAHLPDGSRLEAILPPVAPRGPSVAIRRFQKSTLSMSHLVELGSVSHEAAELLERLVVEKKNVLVSGGTGSGKTSLLRCLAAFVRPEERLVVIEDARELELEQPHVVGLEARPADERGRGAVSIRDLFKATLRMRPDRIVIGELRGGEALELIQAMTSGHGGCLSTIHASHPQDAMRRLETLALMSDVQLPLLALRAQIASAIDVIVQTSRLANGRRGVTHIAEVCPLDEQGQYRTLDLLAPRTHS
jgi:pilus assembly protein CpaF